MRTAENDRNKIPFEEPLPDLRTPLRKTAIVIGLILGIAALIASTILMANHFWGKKIEERALDSINNNLSAITLELDGKTYALKAADLFYTFGVMDCMFPGEIFSDAAVEVQGDSGVLLTFHYPVKLLWDAAIDRTYIQFLNPDAGWAGTDWLMLGLERLTEALPGRTGDPLRKTYDLGEVRFQENCAVAHNGSIHYASFFQSHSSALPNEAVTYPRLTEKSVIGGGACDGGIIHFPREL